MKRIPFLVMGLLVSLQANAEWYHCGQLLDSDKGKLLGEHWVEVSDGRFASVQTQAPAGVEVKDLSGMTCLPGLMDMHTHLTSEYTSKSYINRFTYNGADYALRGAHFAELNLMAGFTTIRDLGDKDNATIALRKAIEKGWIIGPRIYTVGKSIATTGGHADPTNGYARKIMGDPGPDKGVVNSVDEARKAVRQRYKDGADAIKITATGGVLSLAKSGDNPQFTIEEVKAIVDTAKDYNFTVAAHAHGKEGMKRAIIGGVTSIEHGTYMDAENMKLMKKYGTWYVPTITAGKWVAAKSEIDGFFPQVVRPKAAAVGPQILKTFSKAYKAGVKIAFGTDTGVSEHGLNAQEFGYMVEGGMPAMEAIQSATKSAALLLNAWDELGSISVGKKADMVAVKGNPVEDVKILMDISFVMKDGTVYKQ